MRWPKAPTRWIEGRTLFVSVPFTWDLPALRDELQQGDLAWDSVIVGGPAVDMMPGWFNDLPHVHTGHGMPGAMQRVNPEATKTSVGCIRRCEFCAVPQTEGRLRELDDWPDLPIITDNNLLACSRRHFDRVIERLKGHGWADFNQGIDARLLTAHHAQAIAEIGKVTVRLALDSMSHRAAWENAVDTLTTNGVPKSRIRSYALIGFDSSPEEAWNRCQYIEQHVRMVLPMWFHELNALELNSVTKEQGKLGWCDKERLHIMRYYYQHQGAALKAEPEPE